MDGDFHCWVGGYTSWNYQPLAILEESITDTSFVVRFKGWVGAAPDWIDIRFREKDSGDAWTVREKVPTFGWEGGYDALRVTGLKPETTYEIHLRGAKAGQVVTGPWSDIVALSPDYRKIPYPTTLEWRTPVTISFSARSYAGTHGSDKLPITFFLDKEASHDFTFKIRTSPDFLGFDIDDDSTIEGNPDFELDCDSTGYCDIDFKKETQRTTLLTQHEDTSSSHFGTLYIDENSLPSFVTLKGIGQAAVAYLTPPEDLSQRPQGVPLYRADYAALVYSVDEGKELIVGVSLGRAARSGTDWHHPPGEARERLEVPILLTPVDSTESTDYVVSGLTADGKLVFESGDTFKLFSIQASQDTDSLDERVGLEFGTPADTDLLGAGASRTLTINDDDPQIELTAYLSGTLDPARVAEGGGSQSIDITAAFLGGATPPGPTTLTISVAGGTANATDYTLTPAGSGTLDITIADGSNSGTETFTLTPMDDGTSEVDETVVIGASTTANHHVTPTTATFLDNDQRVVLTLSPSDMQESQSLPTRTVTVTATLSPGTARSTDTVVSGTVKDGTANLGQWLDYRLPAGATFTITILQGDTSSQGSFQIIPVGSGSSAEGDETVLVTGSNADLAVATARLTITENRPAPQEVRLYVSPSTISEGDGDLPIRVNVDRWQMSGYIWGTPTTVNVEVVAGTATEGTDYTAIDDFTMTLVGTNGTHYVNLDQLQDIVIEGDETLQFNVTSAHNDVYGNVPNSQGATLTIEDNEPRIVWSLNKTSVSEDGGEQEMEITASLADGIVLPIETKLAVVVGEDTSGGYPSARMGVDFDPVAQFDVVIPANNNSSQAVPFTLKIKPDDDEEGNETLAITGASPDLPAANCLRTNCFYTIPAVVVTITEPGTLIQLSNLDQLNAIRWDLNGDGEVDNSVDQLSYKAAFPGGVTGCTAGPSGTCEGYRLTSDLDFDTNDDGVVDVDDDYWNLGNGWEAIGDGSNAFSATFDGAGYTIHNLFVARSSAYYVALFGNADSSAVIRSVGLESVNVTGNWHIGALMGQNDGSVTASYATGTVSGNRFAGGLVGNNKGSITNSYAMVAVTGSGDNNGGLVGYSNQGTVTDSYATRNVAGSSQVGGLVGYNNEATITNSYATGLASGQTSIGGLIGLDYQGTVSDSYWDTVSTCGTKQEDPVRGKPTSELRAPTGANGIYANWEGSRWDFGGLRQNPVLVVDFNGDGQATWGEFGNQRPGPIEPTIDSITETASELTVQWNKPCWDGGSDITSYDLRYILSNASAADKADDSNWTVEAGVWASGDLEYEISDLSGGETYDVQVRGVSENGAGDWSLTQTGITPSAAQQTGSEITLSVSPLTLDERDGPMDVKVTATHEGTPPDSPATVTLSPGGSATPGSDYYSVITDATITIPGNAPSATTDIQITPVKDEVPEGEETIEINGTAEGFTVSSATVALLDAEETPMVAFGSAWYTAVETGASATVAVTISPISGQQVVVPISITPHEDTETSDYTVTGLINGSLTINQGASQATFTIKANDDNDDSEDETISIELGALLQGVALGTPSMTTVNLEDNGASLFDDERSGKEGQPIPVDILLNDKGIAVGSIPVILTQSEDTGTAVIDSTTGQVTYTPPDDDFNGEHTFTYEVPGVTAGTGDSEMATVRVEVLPVNDAPESVGIIHNQEIDRQAIDRRIDISEKFYDVDGDPLTIDATPAEQGIVTVRHENPLIIVPVGLGWTTVTVKATDRGNLSASHAFRVDVTTLPGDTDQDQPPSAPLLLLRRHHHHRRNQHRKQRRLPRRKRRQRQRRNQRPYRGRKLS